MNARPEAEMRRLDCPQARMFAAPIPNCRAHACPLFREADPITPAWIAAVQRVAAEIGDTTPNKSKAAKIVTADPEAHGVERVFFCGLGGKL